MKVESDISSFLPLKPTTFYILLALADEERHGYGIMKEIDRITSGSVKMGPGTLYGTIKRLLADGLIAESDSRPTPELDDERRRYYRLTKLGRQVMTKEAESLAEILEVAIAKQVLAKTCTAGGSDS